MAAHVRSAAEAERVVQFVKFPPRGVRGLNGSNRDGDFTKIPYPEYVAKCNRDTFVAIQIENLDALNEVEAIARVPDIDLLFIGPADLSSAMGIVGQYDRPDFRAAMDRIIAAADAAKVPFGTVPIGREYTRELLRRGCLLLETGNDIGTIWRGFESYRSFAADLLS
jgi:2-dehydro-3-deoxyglucarate aldolase/4-hydroxy-2-oxoheptanedioate aldolase